VQSQPFLVMLWWLKSKEWAWYCDGDREVLWAVCSIPLFTGSFFFFSWALLDGKYPKFHSSPMIHRMTDK